jgi:glyoxylase-like metal-dependent hydrolase (beta-lactamase superfamily II)
MIETIDLGEGVWDFRTPLWQTNSLLAVADGVALLTDPAFTPEEIEAIGAEVEARAARAAYLLVTHSDYDHVCGIPWFPEAEVVAGADTAEKVSDGSAAKGLAGGGAEWGVSWPADLRVDRVVAAGVESRLGPFRVSTLDGSSHGRDGLGYVLLDQGVLLSGDNLSAISYPLLAGSFERARASTAELVDALDRSPLRHVVPGHGPVLTPDEAREIGRADLAYLDAIAAAAREAADAGMSPGQALVHVFAVEPPRANTLDLEIYDLRGNNARLVLRELGD